MKCQILVPLHTYPDGNPVTISPQVGAIAQHLGAEVHGLVLVAEFPSIYSPLGNLLIDVPALVADEKKKSLARGGLLLRKIQAEVESRNIPFRSTEVECYPAKFETVVVEHARYHDLILIGLGTDYLAPQATAEAVIFGSGKPTLIVPREPPVASLGHVMVAWDGSRVAARAVSDAREFLQRAETVTISSVTDEKALPETDPGSRLARHLERNEIHAVVSQIQSHGRPIAQALQEHAQERGAGLLVMGGFGHSRARDFVLGGATAGVLKKLCVPVLMSH